MTPDTLVLEKPVRRETAERPERGVFEIFVPAAGITMILLAILSVGFMVYVYAGAP